MDNHVAPPLEWHPYYRHLTHLLDWLNEDGSFAKHDSIHVPHLRFHRIQTNKDDNDNSIIETLTLTRRKAAGLAPYVGKPFIYEWNIGIDRYGRQIAGESHIKYIE
jgi:hypothetical protein